MKHSVYFMIGFLIAAVICLLTGCSSTKNTQQITYYCFHNRTQPRVAAMGATPEEAKQVMRQMSCELLNFKTECEERECNEVGVVP